jgi:hypothetical protein
VTATKTPLDVDQTNRVVLDFVGRYNTNSIRSGRRVSGFDIVGGQAVGINGNVANHDPTMNAGFLAVLTIAGCPSCIANSSR